MDIEKIKNTYKWDPARGDYSKSFVSYERRKFRRKQIFRISLTILYILLLILGIFLLYKNFK